MNAGVARHAFQALGDFQDVFDLCIRACQVTETRLLFDGFFQLDIQRGRDELGELIDFAQLHFQHAANVFDGRLGGERTESDDLRHLFAAVFFGNVLNHLAAAAGLEIGIDIGHADTFRIQEAFEQQTILQGVDIGDHHRVGDQAASRGSATGANGNVLVASIADEVPNDQEVAGELHLLDHLDLAAQALFVLRHGMAELAMGRHIFQPRTALFKAFANGVFEEAVDGMFGRHVELRERLLYLFQLHLAAHGDLIRRHQRLRIVGEKLFHLLLVLDVERRFIPLHAVGIAVGLAGGDAHENVMGAGVGLAKVMRVVGGDQRDVHVLGQSRDFRNQLVVLVQVVILNFQEKVLRAEDFPVGPGELAGVFVLVFQQRFVDVAAQTGGKADDAFCVLLEKLFVDARLVIEAIKIAR